MADTVETLEIQVTHRASGAASALKSVANAAKSVGKAVQPAANSVKSMSKAVAKAKSPLENFASSLKRIAFYRFIRSIIKGITEAFTEGLQKAYIFSSGITGEGHRFAEALDAMKGKGNELKGQLGSAFAALLTAIQPILEAIINLCIKVADAISQLLAAFTGTRYLKASNTAAKFADTMKAGGAAAKEWKNQLLGFDEINRLNEPSNGGGGGGSNPLAGYAFEDSPIDPKILAIVQKFKDLVNSLNLEPLKQSLGHLWDAFSKLAEVIGGALKWAWDNVLAPFIKWYTEEYAPVAIDILANAFDSLRIIIEKLSPVFQWIWDNYLKPMASYTADGLIATLKELNDLWKKFNDLMEGKTTVHEFFEELSLVQEVMMWLISPVSTVVLWVKDFISQMKQGISPIEYFKQQLESLKKKLDKFAEKLGLSKTKMQETWGDGKLQISDFASLAIGKIQGVINTISALVGWFQTLHGWIQDAIDGFALLGKAKANANAIQADGSIYLQGFASGGYPDEGQLFIAREAGAEMVGQIGGRTAVANNQDIVEGIRQGVYEAVMAANGNGSNSTSFKLYLDSREIKAGIQRVDRAMGA